jgi:hypothetical protein
MKISNVPGASSIGGQVPYGDFEPRFLEQTEAFFDRAALKTGINEDFLKLVKVCDNILRFVIPLKRDNGTLELITCYRA